MEKIQDQKHNLETLFYCISRMLERSAYYGLRALLVIYMIGEVINMDSVVAIQIFGVFATAIVFTQVLGALLGDLLIGNKRAIIIGCIIEALGAFVLCIGTTYSVYAGLFLVGLGSGLFTPNIISNYGKSYLNKTKLLDAGFTLFYLAINIGSFLGIALLGYIGEEFGYPAAFILCGVISLCAMVPILLTSESELPQNENYSTGRRIITVLIVFIIVGLFWGVYEIGNYRIFDLQLELSSIASFDIPEYIWQVFGSVFLLPISIIAIIIWSLYYNSQFFKLLIGFSFGIIAFAILLFIPDVPEEKHMLFYFASLLFFAISEIHIAPIIHSILTKFANPKYLAILVSLAYVPTRVIGYVFSLFSDELYDKPNLGVTIGLVIMILVTLGIVGFILLDKMTQKSTT
ncbi:MFS transporter [Winogradskyella tangerina]|uniref:MFS transporter n=1 Tax=Winogradskyella tangerina TaxID=2023240 RepID=UPI000DBE282B|nr:MFS transporter [Winogradskyella tangerina]